MKHLIYLSLLLPALLICESTECNGKNYFTGHQRTCTLHGSPTILTIKCNNKAWELQCSGNNGHLDMFFRCLNNPKNTDSFQLNDSSSDKRCFNKNCKQTGNTNCNDAQICISSPINGSYQIEVHDSNCGFVTRPVQTGTFPVTNNQTWIEALQFCRLSSTLVEITNQTVREAVTTILKNNAELQNGTWVGLERSIFGINPEWIWTSQNKPVSTEVQMSNLVVDPLNNHCGKVVLKDNELKVVDENCHKSLPFICQG